MSNDLHEKIIKDINEDEDEDKNVHFMKEHDMVFSKSSNGNIMAGGFTVSSNLLKNNLYNGGSPIEQLDAMIGGNNENGNIKSMAVPFGLFYNHIPNKNSNANTNKNINVDTDVNDDNEISDEIYEELLNKVNANDHGSDKSKKSKNIKSIKNNATKKSKESKESKKSKESKHKNTAKLLPI